MSTENTGAGNEPAESEPGQDLAGFDIAAIIAKHEGALYGGAPVADAPPPASAPAAAATPPPPPAASPPAETPPAPAAEEPPPLKARQLAWLSKQEQQVRAQAAEVKTMKERMEPALAALERGDPAAFFKAVGYDEDKANMFVNQAWKNQLGEDAPAELTQKVNESAFNARMERLEKLVEKALDPNRPQTPPATTGGFDAARAAALESELHAIVKTAPTDLQYFAIDAQEDPASALQALVDVTAAVMHQRGPNGPWPTALEVARMLNEQVATDVAKYSRAPATQPPASNITPPTTRVTSASPTTLSDADTSRRPTRNSPDEPADDAEYLRRGEDAAARLGGLFR